MKNSAWMYVALAAAGIWNAPANGQDAGTWYLSAAGTLSLLDDAHQLVSNLPTPAGYVETNHLMDQGYGAQLAVGRDLGTLRLELEGGYSRNRARHYVAIVPPTGRIPQDGDQNAWRVMLNGYIDWGNGRIQPYVGAGAGWTRVNVGFFAPRAPFPTEAPRRIVDDRFEAFAYQVMVGATIRLTPRLGLSAQYRWHRARDLRGNDLAGYPLNRQHAGQNVDVGLRMLF